MNTNICKQQERRILLVEGTNDCHVVMALCTAHKIPQTFGLYVCGNDDAVLKRLNALIPSADPPIAIGVMLDGDKPSVEGRWQSIRQKIRDHPYSLPEAPALDGTIVDGGPHLPKLGFWLMPDNKTSGMLEDFCADLAEPIALAFAEKCVEEATKRDLSTFKEVHRSKAIIHTYLAWRNEPGRPLGQAITAQALRPDTANALSFVEWLRRLFGEDMHQPGS